MTTAAAGQDAGGRDGEHDFVCASATKLTRLHGTAHAQQ